MAHQTKVLEPYTRVGIPGVLDDVGEAWNYAKKGARQILLAKATSIILVVPRMFGVVGLTS